MSSPFLSAAATAGIAALLLAAPAEARQLRVCADPDNLPYSNSRGEGFENKLMLMVGREIGADVRFVWDHQWRGFVRKTLAARLCDVIPGIAVGTQRARLTKPYYSSSYAFVTRSDRAPVASFSALSEANTIGVQLVGDDGTNTPPIEELAARGIKRNLKGFMVWGQSPAGGKPLEAIMRAVADRTVDVAVVWGPQAGYFATREAAPLTVTAIGNSEQTVLPMQFDIAMGVRKSDAALASELDAALDRLRPEIDTLLASYGVPRVVRDQKGAPP